MRPTTTAVRPKAVNRLTDIDLPRVLLTPWWETDKPRTVRRALTAGERRVEQERAAALRAGLAGYVEAERAAVEAAVAGMFTGFRNLRREGEEAAATVQVTCYNLREFPLWAIQEAMTLISTGKAGLNPTWTPQDAEICTVVRRVVSPYRRTLDLIETVLRAPVEE